MNLLFALLLAGGARAGDHRLGAEAGAGWTTDLSRRWALAGAARLPWTGPVFVLVDAMTISASERVLMALDERPSTELIGVPSNGSIATSVGGELPNGWSVQYPAQGSGAWPASGRRRAQRRT